MKKTLATFLACLVTASFAISTQAATLFWDGDGAGVVGGGAGLWNTTLTRWATASDASTYQAWVNSGANSPTFLGTAGIVTVNSAVTVNLITASVSLYTVNGGSKITFSGVGAGVVANQTTGSFRLSGSYGGNAANNWTLVKSGPGKMYLDNSGNTITNYVMNGGFVAFPAISRITIPNVVVPTNWTFNGGGFATEFATVYPFTVNQGILIKSGGAYFGASNGGNDITIDSIISGTEGGGLFVTGGAPFYSPNNAGCALVISNTANSYDGPTTVTLGTLALGNTEVIPNTSALTLNGGDLLMNLKNETVANVIVDHANSVITGTSTNTLTATNFDLRASGAISTRLAGAGATVTKTTPGTVDLTAPNTFTGGLTLSAGTLRLNNNTAMGTAGTSVVIEDGTTLSTTAGTSRTFNHAYTINGNFTLGQGAGGTANAILAGSLNLSGSTRTITIDNLTNTISGTITNGGLDKSGTGVLLLTGTNTYSGSTIVSLGKLITTANNNIGGGSYTLADAAILGIPLTASGGSLAMSDLTLGTFNGSTMEFDFAHLGFPASKMVSASGAIAVNGTVLVDVKGFDTAGTATLLEYAGARSGTGSFVTGVLPPRVTGSIFDDTANNRVVLNATEGDSLIWVSDAFGLWDANNNGNLIWKLASAGTNTYYQENSVQGDTVRFDDSLTGTNGIIVSQTLSPYRVTVDNTLSNYTFTGTGKISGGGNLIKSGSGELTMGTVNDYTGGTTLNAGTINLATNTVFGTGKLTIAGNGVIRSADNSTNSRTLNVAIDLNANVILGDALNDGELTFNGVIAGNGAITKVGGGTINLGGANTFLGGFAHNAGAVRVNNNTALGAANSVVSLANGVTLSVTNTARTLTYAFNINGDITLGQTAIGTAALTLAGSVNLGGPTRTISISNTTDTISAAVSNGGLIKLGTGKLILTGTNTYTGGTTVSEGTLEGSTLGLQGNIVNNAALVFSQTTAGTNASAISGSGTLTKSGTGNVTLEGANTYSGATTITAGILTINGSLASPTVTVATNGTLGGSGTVQGAVTVSAGGSVGAGGSAGILTLTNGLNLAAGGTNVWELAANSTATAGTDFDQISLTGGNLALGGTSRLLLKFISPATSPTNTDSFWQSAHSWRIISLSGTASNSGLSNFATITGTNNVNGATAGIFSTSVDATGVFLNFTPGAAPQPVLNSNIIGAGTTSAQITWSSVNGTGYTVQYKTNLSQIGWLNLTNVTASGSTTTIVDNTAPAPNERYYRITSP